MAVLLWLLLLSSQEMTRTRQHALPSPLGVSCILLTARLNFHLLTLLLLNLEQQCAVDVREYTSESDGGPDQRVELLVSTDGELQVTRRDALHFKIFGGVSCQLEHFGGKVFENGSDVDSSFRSDAHLVLSLGLEETLDTTAGKLMGHKSAQCPLPFRPHLARGRPVA